MVSRYVKQEGICLVPPHHYRMMPPQRSDGFGVPNQQGGYAPPPPQPQQVVVNPQQGPPPPGGLRGMQQGQNGPPPNQAPTPPNVADPMKVQQSLQQQPPSMNHMFLQQQVRPTAPTYYQRAAGPPSQGPRMPNHSNRPQQPPPLFTPQPQYLIQQPVYITTNSGVQYQSYAQRPPGFVQQLTTAQAVYHAPPMTFNPYNNPPNPPNQVYNMNNYYPTQVMRQPSAPTVTPNNVLPSVPMAPSIPQHQPPFQRQLPKRRANALAIIDPDTGYDRLQEIFEDNSHPPSGDSSARQTPQPPAATQNSKEVQAAFAKQVMQALEGRSQEPPQSNEQVSPPQQQQQPQATAQQGAPSTDVAQPPPPTAAAAHNHVEAPQQAYLPPAVPPPISKMEHVVQASKLQPSAKEFVLSSNAVKDTPIVSANCDSVEVTLANKPPPKERESPAKSRAKPKQEQQPPLQAVQAPAREHRDSFKETAPSPAAAAAEKEVLPEVKNEAEPVPEQPAPKPAEPPAAAAVATPTAVPAPPKEASPKEPQPAEKKKKEAKLDAATSQHQAQDGGNVGKKQNAQRAATTKQQQQVPVASSPSTATKQNTTKPVVAPIVVATVAPVPQPQPPKPAGKAHKKHELNQKGANKEGTDMDAFNDNSHIDKEANCNVINETIEAPTPIPTLTPTPTTNDIINANSIEPPPKDAAPSNVAIEMNKNEPPQQPSAVAPVAAAAAIKPVSEPTVKKSNFNITDIVRDTPKPFVIPVMPVGGGQDEPDRAAVAHASTEKLGLPSKNDVVAKSSDGGRGNDKKLPYRDGQWSPANQQGSMVYQRDFLLALKDVPASRKVPENIPEVVFMLEDNNRGRLSDGRSSMGGRSDFTPSFNYGGKSSSQRGVIPKRPSQGKMDSRSGKSAKPMMKVSISVREDVKLRETENAWRPARIKKGDNLNLSEEDRKTDELYKKVRGILNKLTPQKFDTLLMQIKNLPIDNSSRLQGVIDLVFEKAVDEPNFSVAYANMCKELALMQVPTAGSTAEKQEFVNFRKLLITRCQVEFEKNSIDEEERNKKVQEIEDTADPEKKKDLQFDLEEYDRKLRMKSVGNIRFIGELFKQNMLTVNIMMRCLSNLLENRDEESLECLCKLLTTVGKELESKPVNLQPILGPMRDIISKRQEPKVSSRIRFMLQDVMDLRQNRWVPRRQDFNPKTIDQIQKEAADEQLNIQIMNSGPMPQTSQQQSRRDDRMGGGGGGGGNDRRGGRGGSNKVGDEGWITMGNKGRSNDRMAVQNDRITVQKDKLKNWQPKADEPFGSPAMFGFWGKGSVGSNTKSTPQQSLTNTGNMYAALENMDGEKRGMGPRSSNNDSYHSKGNSLERNYHSKYDGRGSSRSGSQHRSNDAGPSQRLSGPMGPPPMSAAPLTRPPAQHTPPAVAAPTPQPVVAEAASSSAAAAAAVTLTEDQIHRRVTNALEEFVSGNCSVNEYFEEISTDIPRSCIRGIIRDCYLHVLEKNSKVRQSTGSLFAALVCQGRIDVEDYCFNLEDVLSQVEDLEIDIPKIWDYLAELMVDVVCMEAVPLKRLHKSFSILIGQKRVDRLLAPLFKLVVSKKGPNFLQSLWIKSDLQLTDFMDSSIVDNFISINKFEFLIGGATSAGESQLSYEDIQNKLSELLRINNNLDEVSNWITANVGDKVKDKRFIRSLATAVFQDSIEEDKKLKLAKERLIHHSTLFIKYVDNNEEYELQCLYALQSLINRLEHPQGLLLSICETIYEMQTFSQETFVMWELSADPAEQEGKGVALKQLTSFFCQLKENDDEAEEESTGSEPEA